MLNYESIFYGIKALVYGIPIGILAMYFIYNTLKMNFEFGFSVSLLNISVVVAAVFAIVGIAMLYSSRKVRRDNIIDALKQEIV
jgi:putative ABC transport system permease protein